MKDTDTPQIGDAHTPEKKPIPDLTNRQWRLLIYFLHLRQSQPLGEEASDYFKAYAIAHRLEDKRRPWSAEEIAECTGLSEPLLSHVFTQRALIRYQRSARVKTLRWHRNADTRALIQSARLSPQMRDWIESLTYPPLSQVPDWARAPKGSDRPEYARPNLTNIVGKCPKRA